MQKGRKPERSRPFLTFALREAWVYLLVRFLPHGRQIQTYGSQIYLLPWSASIRC
jgi:hypothetical protein